jgi:hypothetical protein
MPLECETANNGDVNRDVRERLIAEANENVVMLYRDGGSRGHPVGTGWVTTDGRILTTLKILQDNRTLFVQQDGKKERIGKNLLIDQVHDLAVMAFVDNTANRRKPVTVPGVAFNRDPQPGDFGAAQGLLWPNLGFSPQVVSRSGSIYGNTPLDRAIPGPTLGQFWNLIRTGSPSRARDFTSNHPNENVLTIGFTETPPGPGAMVLSERGPVGMLTGSYFKTGYVAPAEKIEALLAKTAADSEYVAKSGYQSGVARVRDQPLGRTVSEIIWPVALGTSLASMVHTNGRAAPVLALLSGALMATDYEAARFQGNHEDQSFSYCTLGADGMAIAGAALAFASLFSPKRYVRDVRALGNLGASFGLGARLLAELKPVHYAFQGAASDALPTR